MAFILCAACLPGCKSPEHTPEEPTETQRHETDTSDPMTAVGTLIDAPPDFAQSRIDNADYPIPAYAEYLRGVRICLDPGHGGDAHKAGFKRGPTGVREAEINLRVAQYLRDLLQHAGAEVRLTRESDVDLSLEQRAEIANRWPADLFISCHHNAMSNNPDANHVSVWHHGGVDHHPASLDLARHLCRGLMQTMSLPQIATVPLRSDQLMYASGFAVLRHAKVAAALTETSFFTNPEEEQRLRDPEYNFREAYGMFLGLAWYAYGGLPRVQLIDQPSASDSASSTWVFDLDDGLRARKAWGWERQMILTDSIAVRVDDRKVDYLFDPATNRLTVPAIAAANNDVYQFRIEFQNAFKHSVLNPVITVAAQGAGTD